jgi:DNA replication initiation complex subunit (GINS family)
MLTFETLSRIAREEKSASSLTRLPDGFFESVTSYISKKAHASEGKEDAWEYENAKMILNDILRSRERKIVLSAFSFVDTGMEPANLTQEEKALFDQTASLVLNFRTERKKALEPGQHRKSMIAFLEEVPQFMGSDMKAYGPFGIGDIANLPEDVSRILVEKGAAKPIEGKAE